MAYIPVSQLNQAELAARREKERLAKRRYRAKQKAMREAQRAEQAAQMAREAEKARKAAERRAKHAAYERERRARLKALSPKELELLQKARRWGLRGITSTNVKTFKAYLDTRESQRQLSFHYEELVEASKDFDALIKARRDSAAIMEDFADYQADVINMVESVRADLTQTKRTLYTASAYDEAWSRYVEDVEDEMLYYNKKLKKKRG